MRGKPKRQTVKDYYEEQFMFGGEVMTRKQIIDELKRIGGTPQMVDRYLQGLDLAKEIQARNT